MKKNNGENFRRRLKKMNARLFGDIPSYLLQIESRSHGFYVGTKKIMGAMYYVLIPPSRGHVIVIGGSGSGKSSAISKQTLESWDGQMAVIDIKGELSERYIELYNDGKVTKPYIIFDPTKQNGWKYDIFNFLRNNGDDNLVQNTREIVTSIIALPHDVKDPFWIESARNLLTGELLYYYDIGASFSRAMSGIQTIPVDTLIDKIVNSENNAAIMFVNQFRNMDTKVLAGIATELSNNIMVFATDPLIKNVMGNSEEDSNCLSWNDLEKMNIFLKLPEDKLEQWSGLTKLLINQLIRTLERRPDNTTAKGKDLPNILIMLDEGVRIGKLDSIKTALSTLRSKSVSIALFCQSLAQIDEIYGKDARRTIVDNCPYKIILNATDAESQEYFSKIVGTHEVENESYSRNYDSKTKEELGYSINKGKQREAIIQPHEFATLKDVVFMTPEGSYRVKKTPYYVKPKKPFAQRIFSGIKKAGSAIFNWFSKNLDWR